MELKKRKSRIRRKDLNAPLPQLPGESREELNSVNEDFEIGSEDDYEDDDLETITGYNENDQDDDRNDASPLLDENSQV